MQLSRRNPETAAVPGKLYWDGSWPSDQYPLVDESGHGFSIAFIPGRLSDHNLLDDKYVYRREVELCAQATNENTPGFVTFLKEGQGLLQFLAPEFKGGCLFAFSSALRAADYARVQVPEKKFEYFCSSPAQAAFGIAELSEKAGISHIALDRCPRSKIFMAVDVSNRPNAADLIRVWKIAKAIEMTRCNLYLDYARAAAAAGEFLRARNVPLELVGHVTAEDPRAHVLLAKLGLMLRDKKLWREARTYLGLLRQNAAIAELETIRKNKRVSF